MNFSADPYISMASVSTVRPDAPGVDPHVHILPDEILHAVQDEGHTSHVHN
jgi:hypothetical protein